MITHSLRFYMVHLSFFVVFTSALLCIGARAQTGDAARSQPQRPADATETKSETIERCLQDMESQKPSTRRQAVLILGKYRDSPKALSAVIEALTDPVARVRRTALVSLSERRLLPSQAAPNVLGMLNDEDVHIRRIASSLLPQAMSRYRRRIAVRNSDDKESAGLPPELRRAVREAFGDEDSTVRANMLSNAQYFRSILTPELLEPLVQDDKTTIQLLAIEAAHRALKPDAFVRVASAVVNDKDKKVRLYIARYVRAGISEQALDVLRSLSKDAETDVAVLAISKLLRRQEFSDWARLKELLQDPSLDSSIGVNAIRFLVLAGEEGIQVLHDVRKMRRARFRAVALRTLGRLRRRVDLTVADLMTYLSDPSGEVRDAAMELLQRRDDLEASHVRELVDATHVNVRQFAVRASRSLDKEEAGPLLLNFLPDDNAAVRRAVIQQFGKRQLEGWRRILRRSLADESSDIRQTAVKLLMENPGPETPEVLRRHMQETDSARIKQLISRYLAKRQSAN